MARHQAQLSLYRMGTSDIAAREVHEEPHLSASRFLVALRPHQVMRHVPQVWQGLINPCRTCLQCRTL